MQSNVIRAGRTMPDAFVILFFVVLLAAIATHFIPAGYFQLAPASEGQRALLVADSYQQAAEQQGVALFATGDKVGFLNFAFEGMVSGDKWGSAIGVMMFIILTGGAFGIVMRTGAVDNGILAFINKTQGFEALFIPSLFILFSLGGAIFGMGEEAIAFCIVLLPLMSALGYNAYTTVMVTYVATQIGFATSWMNPFSVAIAQGIADLPLMSGMEFRLVLWLVFTLAGVVFTVKISRLPLSKTDSTAPENKVDLAGKFAALDGWILAVFFVSIVWVIWGVVSQGYYIPEIASQFFSMGIVIAAVAVIGKRLSVNDAADAFKSGAQSLLPAAMIVGMAKGIVIMLGGDQADSPSVLNTLLYYAGQLIGDLPQMLSALFMFIFQAVFNFFIASGSGQAALTMPLMAPLGDLVGVSRQIAVLAFQLGDGLTNIIIPTSASLIGCLGVAKIDWLDWAKFIARFMALMLALAAICIVIAVQINYH